VIYSDLEDGISEVNPDAHFFLGSIEHRCIIEKLSSADMRIDY